jgi:hypothetical protein
VVSETGLDARFGDVDAVAEAFRAAGFLVVYFAARENSSKQLESLVSPRRCRARPMATSSLAIASRSETVHSSSTCALR